jgi:hypothetical protein
MSPVADSTLHSLPLYNFRSRTIPPFLILIRFQKSPLANLILALEFREGLAKYESTSRLALREACLVLPFTSLTKANEAL